MGTECTMVDNKILDLLRRVDFFDILKLEDLELLCALIKPKTMGPDEVIYHQGDPPDAFYIIESGHVEIISEYLGERETIATFSRSGDYFGEIALIAETTRSATVKTITESHFLLLRCEEFNKLKLDHPSIYQEVTQILTHGTRQCDSHYTETILEKNRQLAEVIQNLNVAQEELLRRERLSLVGKLASGIIHDLKKPMTCISGYAQLLSVKSIKEDKQKKYAEKIAQEVLRLVDMVNEILQFARGEQKINRVKVSAEDWISDVTDLLIRNFEDSKVAFKKSILYNGDLYIDFEKFKSVFFNIAANAMKAMPEGGTFTFNCIQEGEFAKLEFIDTGLGMVEEVKQHVFEDFFSQAKDGTGLGMAIVKRIVEGHEGTINVESELGRGTKFTILLPLDDK